MSRRRVRMFAALTLLVVTIAGCASDGSAIVHEQSWEQIDLPAGFMASNLLVVDGRLVVGGNTNGEEPALLVAGESGEPLDASNFVSIPVEPASFYGAKARWYSLIADGSQLRALGGRTGGGHGNPRWSTWSGDLEGLAEQPAQGMEVFGGWRGGGMVGVAVADGRAVIVGGRAGEEPGLDIAVWLEEGDDWVEQPSVGTALAATRDVLPFPTGVVSRGADLLITGFTQVLGGGQVKVQAAVWIGGAAEGWQRIDLTSDASESSAHLASCDATGCIIVGAGDGRLLAWSYASGEAHALELPTVEVGNDDSIPAPVTWNGRAVIASPNGAGSVVAVEADSGRWELWEGPTGIPIAVVSSGAESGAELYVLTTDGATVRLWSTTAGR